MKKKILLLCVLLVNFMNLHGQQYYMAALKDSEQAQLAEATQAL